MRLKISQNSKLNMDMEPTPDLMKATSLIIDNFLTTTIRWPKMQKYKKLIHSNSQNMLRKGFSSSLKHDF